MAIPQSALLCPTMDLSELRRTEPGKFRDVLEVPTYAAPSTRSTSSVNPRTIDSVATEIFR